MRRLPPELIDHIVDYLHDERSTLQKCSLVNHQWLISSWFHLFETLHIKVKEKEQIDAVLDKLNESPRFHAYVRTLHLEGSALKPYYFATSEIDGARIIHIYKIFSYLHTYVINGFRLATVDAAEDSNTLQQAPAPSQRILPKLVLADVDMDQAYLIRLLSSLRPIREIQFLCVTVSGLDISPDHPDTIPTLGLRSATFEGCYAAASFSAASFFKHFPHLKCDFKSLDIDILNVARGGLSVGEQIRITGSLINEVGPQLADLRLDLLSSSGYYSGLDSDSLWKPFNLTRCTSLQSLWVSIDDGSYDNIFKDNPLLSWIAVLMASAQTFQHLTLALGSAGKDGPFPDCVQVGISQFESFLVSLPSLQSITFVADRNRKDHRRMAEVPEPIHSDKRQWLIDKLPELQSKGILRIPDI